METTLKRMQNFTFNYAHSNIKPMIPCFITVEARNIEDAREIAKEKISKEKPFGLNLTLFN